MIVTKLLVCPIASHTFFPQTFKNHLGLSSNKLLEIENSTFPRVGCWESSHQKNKTIFIMDEQFSEVNGFINKLVYH